MFEYCAAVPHNAADCMPGSDGQHAEKACEALWLFCLDCTLPAYFACTGSVDGKEKRLVQWPEICESMSVS